MLRFIRDHRDAISADRVIFIHEHTRSRHYRAPIWQIIDRAIRTPYFWTHDFGNIVVCDTITTKFRSLPDGSPDRSVSTGRGTWIRLDPIINYLFADTSLQNATAQHRQWRTPCCSTFFLHPKLLRQRTEAEYDIMVRRLHWLVQNPTAPVWQAAFSGQRARSNHNYIMSEILERSWTMILAGVPNPELDMTIPW